MRSLLFSCLTILALIALSASTVLAQGFGFPVAPTNEESQSSDVSRSILRAADLNSFKNTIWNIVFIVDGNIRENTLYFQDSFETVNGHSGLVLHTRNADETLLKGHCFLGSDYGVPEDYHIIINNPEYNSILYMDFNTDDGTGSGAYYYSINAQNSPEYTLNLNQISEEGTYYVPFIPNPNEYPYTGFGLSNAGYDKTNTVKVEYYNNNGQKQGEDTTTIAPNRHAAFGKTAATTEHGWAKITSTGRLYGMALIFGPGMTTFFDVDIANQLSKNLTIAHMDTDVNGHWSSYAMLCNPNSSQAEVTLNFYPGNQALPTDSDSLIIPAMGSVQYNLGEFQPNGTVQIVSSQPLAGFMLYDGRDSGNDWLGGLSIVPTR